MKNKRQMAGIQYLGQVGATGTATGPHKHVYVKDLKTGAFLDPSTIRTPLLGVRIGEKRVPALLQDAQGKINFNPEAGITLTSRFGPRAAPTPGASSYHQGEDWALPEGTPVFYEGGGTFKPLANQGGYGNLATLTTGDNKYEIGFGHMKSLGQASALPGQTTQPQVQQSESTRTEDILKAFLYGAGYKDKPKEPKETFQDSLKRQLLESVASSPSPSKFLSSFMINNPYAAVPQLNPEALLDDLYG